MQLKTILLSVFLISFPLFCAEPEEPKTKTTISTEYITTAFKTFCYSSCLVSIGYYTWMKYLKPTPTQQVLTTDAKWDYAQRFFACLKKQYAFDTA